MAVNNNAAAVMLVLAALAAGREVPISRGELIEIGDGFRIPDVLAQSGARLVEVGSTNRTRIGDYARVVGPETGAILRVHQSNFRIVGFTGAPSLGELAALAAEHGVPVIDDLGSGQLIDLPDLADEPTARSSIEAGATVVCFSGDKLLGGPQAGVIVGTADADGADPAASARARRPDRQAVAGRARGDARALSRPGPRPARDPGAARGGRACERGARPGGGAGRAARRHGRGHAGPRRRRRGAAARARELRLRARRRRRAGGVAPRAASRRSSRASRRGASCSTAARSRTTSACGSPSDPRHRRTHRPRQDRPGGGAHRGRHRPAAPGEGARHLDRARLRAARAAIRAGGCRSSTSRATSASSGRWSPGRPGSTSSCSSSPRTTASCRRRASTPRSCSCSASPTASSR